MAFTPAAIAVMTEEEATTNYPRLPKSYKPPLGRDLSSSSFYHAVQAADGRLLTWGEVFRGQGPDFFRVVFLLSACHRARAHI